MKYDPEQAPDAQAWLRLDEQEAINLVRSYHRRNKIPLPNAALHAVFHVTVENQIALGETAVLTTLNRLQREGLNRHEAIHAIGSVLADHLYDLIQSPEAPNPEGWNKAYLADLRRLTATLWRRQAEEP